ncbi:MAG: uncharacterized protein K0S42_3556, partial [Microvirga sp.]|nr:uncharacterized protein [Microvirga sp.]
GEETVSFRVFEAGQLRLPSGKIIACDPFVSMDRPAFTVSVPAGEYPVRLALVEGGNDARRVALARLAISSAPVVRWEMALVAGQDAATLKADEIFGYPVDAGTGSFLDAETGAAAWPKMMADEDIAQGWITQGDKLSAGPGTPTFHLEGRATSSCSPAAGATASTRRGSAMTRKAASQRWSQISRWSIGGRQSGRRALIGVRQLSDFGPRRLH